MGIDMEPTKILGIGNLHHFIFKDGANNKRHVVIFIAIVCDKDDHCAVRYLAMTLREYRRARKSTEVLPVDLDKFRVGELVVSGKTENTIVVNDGYLETLRIPNSILKKSLIRGYKLESEINSIFGAGGEGLIIRYQGKTPEGARVILHIQGNVPKYSLVYYPERPHIGLFDGSLNSRDAFPHSAVILLSGNNYSKVLEFIANGNRKSCTLFKKIVTFFKRLLKKII